VRADDVQYVAARVEAFKAEIPPYPAGVFKVTACLRAVRCFELACALYHMLVAGGGTTAPSYRPTGCVFGAQGSSSWPASRKAQHNYCCVQHLFLQGRGIVMIGGGLRYMTSAWVAVHMIRRSGCRLPIEMW
jgi:hypothetical protein